MPFILNRSQAKLAALNLHTQSCDSLRLPSSNELSSMRDSLLWKNDSLIKSFHNEKWFDQLHASDAWSCGLPSVCTLLLAASFFSVLK